MSALDDKLKLHSGGCGVSLGSPFCTCLSGKARTELDEIRSTVTALEAEVARLREALLAADVVLETVARLPVVNSDRSVRLTVAAAVASGACKRALAPAAQKENDRG